MGNFADIAKHLMRFNVKCGTILFPIDDVFDVTKVKSLLTRSLQTALFAARGIVNNVRNFMSTGVDDYMIEISIRQDLLVKLDWTKLINFKTWDFVQDASWS